MTHRIEELLTQIARHNFTLFFLLAGMGAGKDFVGKLLQEYGQVTFHHLSSSAAIRRRAKESGEIGEACAAAEAKMKCGQMVDDDLTTVVVLDWMLQRLQAGVRTFLLDGFPRNNFQFTILQRLETLKATQVIEGSILLCQPFGICLAQVLGQRRNELCRSDDNIRTFLYRWNNVFLGETVPMIKEIQAWDPKRFHVVQQADLEKVLEVARVVGYRGIQMERLKSSLVHLRAFQRLPFEHDVRATVAFAQRLDPPPTEAELREVARLAHPEHDGLEFFRHLPRHALK